MRILVIPDCTNPIRRDILFLMSWKWVEYVHRVRDDVFFEVVLPAKDKVWGEYPTEEYEKLERVRLHYVPMISTGGIQQVQDVSSELVNIIHSPDGVWATRPIYELFNLGKTGLYYDAVHSMRAILAPVLKKLLKAKFPKFAVNVPLFNFSGSVRVSDGARMVAYADYGEEDVLAETVGWLTDYACFMTEQERKIAMENAMKYLAPSQVLRLERNSIAGLIGGLDCEKLEAKMIDRKPKDELVVFFGGRWVEGHKGFTTALETVDKIYRVGRKIRMICTTPEDESERIAELRKRYPFAEFLDKCDQATFFEKMKEGHVFLCYARFEPFGYAWAEMMYSGMLGVFVAGSDTALNLAPPGYPLVVPNKGDVLQVLDFLSKSPQECDPTVEGSLASKWLPKVREHLKGYDKSVQNMKVMDWMEKVTDEHYARDFPGTGSFADLCRLALDEFGDGPVPIGDVYEMMSKKSKSGRPFGNKGDILNRFYVRRQMLACGWKDLSSGPDPVLVRRKA